MEQINHRIIRWKRSKDTRVTDVCSNISDSLGARTCGRKFVEAERKENRKHIDEKKHESTRSITLYSFDEKLSYYYLKKKIQ